MHNKAISISIFGKTVYYHLLLSYIIKYICNTDFDLLINYSEEDDILFLKSILENENIICNDNIKYIKRYNNYSKINSDKKIDCRGQCWRYLVFFEFNYDYICVIDCDTKINDLINILNICNLIIKKFNNHTFYFFIREYLLKYKGCVGFDGQKFLCDINQFKKNIDFKIYDELVEKLKTKEFMYYGCDLNFFTSIHKKLYNNDSCMLYTNGSKKHFEFLDYNYLNVTNNIHSDNIKDNVYLLKDKVYPLTMNYNSYYNSNNKRSIFD